MKTTPTMLAGIAIATLVVGCAPRAPRMLPPDSVEAFCAEKEPRGTAIASIVASVADLIPVGVPVPDEATERKTIVAGGGVIGHWKSQPLYVPEVARALGASGDLLDVRAVAITNALAGANSRIIYVTVALPGGPKRLALRAFDIQNACVEGRRLSLLVRRVALHDGAKQGAPTFVPGGS